jgi:hypothetical protein
MYALSRAAVSALSALALVGCATPLTQPLKRDVATAAQPVEVKVGIRQPELYGAFEVSRAGQAAAAGCGAVPGIGILLAAACGAAAGAVDATINASRAKAADETIRPLKDEIVDLKFDQAMNEAIAKALTNVPGMSFSGVVVTKETTDAKYEETYKASTAGGVMFVNVDYHMSIDLSTLQMSARALLYPRSPAARTAAGLPGDINAPPAPNQATSMMDPKNAAYRSMVVYRAKLPLQGKDPAEHLAAWKADNGRLLRTSLHDGMAQLGRLLVEDVQRGPDAPALPSLGKVEGDNRLQADLVAESHGGKLLRYPTGALYFQTTLGGTAATTAQAPTAGGTAPAAPAANTATAR